MREMTNPIHYSYWDRKDQPFLLMKIGVAARLNDRV
jgi:hypothetical protein